MSTEVQPVRQRVALRFSEADMANRGDGRRATGVFIYQWYIAWII